MKYSISDKQGNKQWQKVLGRVLTIDLEDLDEQSLNRPLGTLLPHQTVICSFSSITTQL